MSKPHFTRQTCQAAVRAAAETLRIAYHTIVDRPGQHAHTAAWRGRCTYCGHRVGANVRQTREQPWRAPSEIVLRFLAMRNGSQP